jgi:hypothetical protein
VNSSNGSTGQLTAVRQIADPAEPPQYSRKGVLAVWAAAAVPMGVLSWVIAPAIAGHGASEGRFAVTLLVAMTFGLVWQAVMVLVLVSRERRDPSSAGPTGS